MHHIHKGAILITRYIHPAKIKLGVLTFQTLEHMINGEDVISCVTFSIDQFSYKIRPDPRSYRKVTAVLPKHTHMAKSRPGSRSNLLLHISCAWRMNLDLDSTNHIDL